MVSCAIDLFASRLTAQLLTYMSRSPDSEALATDALSQPWNFPWGFALIRRCLNKVHWAGAPELVLITPISPTQTGFSMLVWMSIRRPFQIPTAKQLLKNHKGESHPLISQGSLNVATWLISLIWRSLATEGISEAAAKCILSSWRQDTEGAYSYWWIRWERWCIKQGCDPIHSLLSTILQFPSAEFKQVKQYWMFIQIGNFYDARSGCCQEAHPCV